MSHIVATYTNADLDAISCALAYAEFLQKQGMDAHAVNFGKPLAEAKYALNLTNTRLPNTTIGSDDTITIVDHSDRAGLDPSINISRVTEVIDHRATHEAHSFQNASTQIELIGSCATLIAEKFRRHGFEPSRSNALLLYGAIISNTMHFRASVTTLRDRQAAEWLEPIAKPSTTFIGGLFAAKANITDIAEALEQDRAEKTLNGERITICQLEAPAIEKIVSKQLSAVETYLRDLDNRYDLALITCVDPVKGGNIFIATSKAARERIAQALDLTFEGSCAKKEDFLLRKQLWAPIAAARSAPADPQ